MSWVPQLSGGPRGAAVVRPSRVDSSIILYVYDTYEILVDPIKTRSDADILRAYDVLYVTLEHSGHAPKLNIIDTIEQDEKNIH